MADAEDIQPLVCDNGTGMVKVMKVGVIGYIVCSFRCEWCLWICTDLVSVLHCTALHCNLDNAGWICR